MKPDSFGNLNRLSHSEFDMSEINQQPALQRIYGLILLSVKNTVGKLQLGHFYNQSKTKLKSIRCILNQENEAYIQDIIFMIIKHIFWGMFLTQVQVTSCIKLHLAIT